MRNRLNFIISLLIVASMVFSCSWFRAKKDIDKDKSKTRTTETKVQYPIAENFKDDKSQIIDLIEGPAEFDMKYEGTSAFTVRLLYPDGTILDSLANATGSYKGSKVVNVPKTGSYIVDVRCKGTWSVYRK